MRTILLDFEGQTPTFGPISVAENAWDRMRGLLARPPLRSYEGMLIMNCCSVHTVGMKYAIDVIFLRSDGEIIRVVENLRPLRMTSCYEAEMTLELFTGSARKLQLIAGGRLSGFRKLD